MRSFISQKKLSYALFLCFFLVYIVLSIWVMLYTPLMEFDGANRSEAAKQMKLHNEFLAPLTGSPFLRNEDLKLQIQDNPQKYLYYHLERPPFVYWLMILSTNIFGNQEFAYRFPSFLIAMCLFPLFFFGMKKFDSEYHPIALFVSLLCFITSFDWWSSGQMALLDTTLSTFMFLSLFFVMFFNKYKKTYYLFLSGIFLGLAILSKGPPSVILIIPFIVMVLLKQIKMKEIGVVLFTGFLLISPWLFLSIHKFGFNNFIHTFLFSFVFSRISEPAETQQAPTYWYVRWLLDTFRPGFILFLICTFFDFVYKSIDKSKIVILSYIFGGLLLYSFAVNKVWWYILPLIPAMCFYIYVSLAHFLKEKKVTISQISILIIMSSLPIFYKEKTSITLLYGLVLFLFSFLIFSYKKVIKGNSIFFLFSLFVSLNIFLMDFPRLTPIYSETKDVAFVFKKIHGQKCLYIRNMPYESVLFYSNAGEINIFYPNQKLSKECDNYLITPDVLDNKILLYQKDDLKLYKI
jgi:hypothetical protein